MTPTEIREAAAERGFMYTTEAIAIVEAEHGVLHGTALKAVHQAIWRGTRGIKLIEYALAPVAQIDIGSFERWLAGYKPKKVREDGN